MKESESQLLYYTVASTTSRIKMVDITLTIWYKHIICFVRFTLLLY